MTAQQATLEVTAGTVTAVRGSVVDVAFPDGHLPEITHALEIEWDGPHRLVAEVQQHLDPATVRAVAMQNTAGLRRGSRVRDTGGPIPVPVGDAVLGRLINVIGESLDRREPFAADVPRWPIHRQAPALAALDRSVEIFHTGIKVVDLLAPLLKGGKAAPRQRPGFGSGTDRGAMS